jgi:hypothetical protein
LEGATGHVLAGDGAAGFRRGEDLATAAVGGRVEGDVGPGGLAVVGGLGGAVGDGAGGVDRAGGGGAGLGVRFSQDVLEVFFDGARRNAEDGACVRRDTTAW